MTVGREGVTWVPALSGATTMPCQTMVAIDGEALRVDVDHDFLAYLLGASRQTVTTLTNEFAKKGYIESDRSITVPDRTQLERAACECYSVIKEQFAKVWTGQ